MDRMLCDNSQDISIKRRDFEGDGSIAGLGKGRHGA